MMYYLEDKIEYLYECGYEYDEISYMLDLYQWYVINVLNDYFDYLDDLYY